MTVALNDAVLLTSLLEKLPSFEAADEIVPIMKMFHSMRRRHCVTINILAQALYTLFSAGDDPEMIVLRESCFEYLGLGGVFTNHPIGLLSG